MLGSEKRNTAEGWLGELVNKERNGKVGGGSAASWGREVERAGVGACAARGQAAAAGSGPATPSLAGAAGAAGAARLQHHHALTTHSSKPSRMRSSSRSFPMNTILLTRFSPACAHSTKGVCPSGTLRSLLARLRLPPPPAPRLARRAAQPWRSLAQRAVYECGAACLTRARLAALRQSRARMGNQHLTPAHPPSPPGRACPQTACARPGGVGGRGSNAAAAKEAAVTRTRQQGGGTSGQQLRACVHAAHGCSGAADTHLKGTARWEVLDRPAPGAPPTQHASTCRRCGSTAAV